MDINAYSENVGKSSEGETTIFGGEFGLGKLSEPDKVGEKRM
jgi:hypothetical protein